MADSTLSNLTSLTLPSQATDLLLVGRGTARPNKVAMSDALNSSALAATTSTYGVAQLAASGGTTAGTVVQATDARLSDARNPPDGSKGDIVVSGSGSTWTIKTNPTLSGNVTATGWIKTADGTAAAPAYAFTSESGLGFYRAAATGVGFATGGANSLTFYPNGEVYGAQGNNRLALYPTGSIGLIASSSNQTITITPSGAATAGSLVVSRLTSTNQTLALLNYGTDELMSIVGTGYTGVGSRSNTGFLLYSNNTERARFMAGGNFLIAKTIDNSLGRLQVNGAITMEETAGTGLFGFFGGSTLVYGSLAANPVVLRTNNTAALTLDTSQNATFAKDILLGTSGPSVPSTLSARAPRQGLVFNGTVATSTSNAVVFGTGDFTVAAWVNPANLAGTQCVFGGANNAFVLRMDSGVFGVGKQSINGPFSVTSAVTAGKMVFVVYRRSGTTGTGYLNGIAGTAISDTNDYSVASTFIGSSVDTGTAVWSGTISGALIFNRALSATEIVALYENGAPAAVDLPSQVAGTALLTGDNSTFASGAGNWAGVNGGSVSAGSGVLTVTSTGGFIGGRTALNIVTKGSRYRLQFTLGSFTGTVTQLYVFTSDGNAFSNPVTGTTTVEFTATATSYIGFSAYPAQSGTFTIDNVTLVPLGAVLAPDAAQTGGGLTWYDTSGNGNNITLPATGVAWNVPTSGNVTSGGQLNLRAGGTNQLVYIAPSGTGTVRFGGTTTATLFSDSGLNLSIGTASGGAGLHFLSGSQTVLLGTTTNSSNGRLQLATHTAATGGIGFGTDTALYRASAGQLYLDAPASTSGAFWVNAGAGNTSASLNLYPQGTGVAQVSAVGAASLVLRTNNATALSLDSSQNANLGGNYFFIGGAGSNFYIRSTGSNNGLIRGNILSADFAAAFVLRNDTGTVEYVRVENPSGAVLLGTATNSSNGRLQLATHTANTGGIGFGTDVTLYRSAADVLRTDDRFQAESTSGTNSAAGILGVLNTSGAGVTNSFGVDARILVNNSSGSTTSAIGLRSLARVSNASTVSGLYSMYAQVDNPGSGTISFAFGLYVAPITVGATNYAIWTEGATSSRFGGNVIIEKPIADNCGVSVINSNSSGLPGLYLEGDAGNYALIRRNNSGLANPNRLEYIATGTGANHYFNTNVTIAGNLTVTGTISPSSGAGLTNVWIPASQWIPRTTTGCGVDSTETTTNRQNFDELLFDAATIEYAQALVRMPSNYNNGTVTARFFWSSSSSTGSVVWALQARAFADDDALDTAFGTAQTVTDTLLATGDMHISAATSAVTSGGTPAATTPLQFQIYRDATNGSDTLGSDARLLGVEILYTSV